VTTLTPADLDRWEKEHEPTPSEPGSDDRSMRVDGLRLVYREEGSADGPAIVVLHGWGASIAAVASIMAIFRSTHRVLALDLPGFGASDPPPVAWSSDEYVALVMAFLSRLGVERASIIGHSYGGKLGILLAAQHPELVDRLVLINSAGIRGQRDARYYAKVYGFKTARLLFGLPPLSGPFGAPIRRRFERRFGSDDYRQAGAMRGTLVRVVNEDVRHLLPRIAAPTLLIWGDLDDSTPLADGKLMESLIPDVGLVVFSGVGLFAYAEDYPRFARVVGHLMACVS